MNKKETTVTEWVMAFRKGTSFWKNSVHIDEFLGKKGQSEVYFHKSFPLLLEVIDRSNEVGLTQEYNLCLSFYLKDSVSLDVSMPCIPDLWNDFSHTPPELSLIEKPVREERETVECYENPISLSQLDRNNILGSHKESIAAYYSCWRSKDEENEDASEYQRIIVIEYRSK